MNNLSLTDMRAVDEIIRAFAEVIQTDLDTKQKRIRLGTEYMAKNTLLAHYATIDTAILVTLLCKLLPVWHTLKTPMPYRRTCLFRAYVNHAGDTYYTQYRLADARNVCC